jgi:hypothetical protein
VVDVSEATSDRTLQPPFQAQLTMMVMHHEFDGIESIGDPRGFGASSAGEAMQLGTQNRIDVVLKLHADMPSGLPGSHAEAAIADDSDSSLGANQAASSVDTGLEEALLPHVRRAFHGRPRDGMPGTLPFRCRTIFGRVAWAG